MPSRNVGKAILTGEEFDSEGCECEHSVDDHLTRSDNLGRCKHVDDKGVRCACTKYFPMELVSLMDEDDEDDDDEEGEEQDEDDDEEDDDEEEDEDIEDNESENDSSEKVEENGNSE